VSQKNKSRPNPFKQIVAALIGFLLLAFVYYDTLPKDIYTRYTVGKVAGLGVLLIVAPLWFWF